MKEKDKTEIELFWNSVKNNMAWSGAVVGQEWKDLWAQEEIEQIYNAAIQVENLKRENHVHDEIFVKVPDNEIKSGTDFFSKETLEWLERGIENNG